MRKINYKIVVMLLLSFICILFVYNDYFLYKTPIMKISSIENKLEKVSGEEHYVQNITGTIMNGKFKGNVVKVTNRYSKSQVYEDKINNNSELLVKLTDDGDTVSNIISIKRDKYLVILLVIFIDLIILVAGKKGIKTLTSLFLNVLITSAAIIFFKSNYMSINMLLLYIIISIVFIIVSLLIANGKCKKTLAAIVSSIISLFFSFGVSFLLINIFGNNLYIWGLEYIEAVHDYHNFLYVSILLSGLGAIMDIAITISSSLNELIVKNPKIDRKTLFKSGRIISKDIVGTMINVMLFTCYTSVIPTVLLAFKNSMPLATALDYYGSLELTIVLCNCVGIALTIPISLYISIFILNRNKKGSGFNE